LPFTLPELPYARDALVPVLSKETLDYHYGKHHNAYVVNLNKLTDGTEYASWSLQQILTRIKELPAEKQRGVFNNAAQIWNHTFYWESLAPVGQGGEPSAKLEAAIASTFGGIDSLKEKLSAESLAHFGSGWGWLVANADGKLSITSTHDADSPVAHGLTPLLTFDVWEHAYYIDYRNGRGDYLKKIWDVVNWKSVSARFA
jgi:Fe-Mn family superoxide dismutase